MELRELAERILRSPRLEDKLISVSSFEDAAPGAYWEGPAWPARPAALALDVDRPKSAFPPPSQLADPKARGRVLHFFANHELLAMELMALALVRFPDAPAAFRAGIGRTLVEEQDHLRGYLTRMEQLGVQFGELHNSPYFWTSLAPMSHPIHYCAGLSLAFEQANLDYCVLFGEAFSKVGDEQTRALMERVYEDEIGHVRHGLRWYRTWKQQDLSDWQAFEAALLPPLTPARAKGRPYDRVGRERACFDSDWIDQLQVYGRTKGRPPTLWWFNPGCERTLLGQQLSRPTLALRKDLGSLPMFMARKDDAVLLPVPPTPAWLREWQDLGVSMPEWLTDPKALAGRKMGSFVPFGPGPEADRVHPGPEWKQAHFRKSSALSLLAKTRERHGLLAGGPECQGHLVLSILQLLEHIEALSVHHDTLLLKQDLGSSGQGQRRISVAAGLDETTQAWAVRILQVQGALVVEGLLDRVADVSALYKGRRLLGLSRPLVDRRGVWRGQLLSEPWAGLEIGPRRLLTEGKQVLSLYKTLADDAPVSGFWNIDALVYTYQDTLRLKSVVELNPRMTMGHLARGIARWVRHGRPAMWTLHHRRQVGDLAAFADGLRERLPAVVEQGQLVSGVRFSNDPSLALDFLGVIWVGAQAVEAGMERVGA